MQRKFEFSIGEYYHVYNRGTDKRIIFTSLNDYHRFIALLHLCNSSEPVHIGNILQNNQGLSLISLINVGISDRLVHIGAYCLMPNHFHLLLREKQENGISLFMKKLLTAYSMYFNKKYERSGALFEGPFKATHADTDVYLKYLFSYIHLNPVKIIDPNWKEDGIKDREVAKKYLTEYAHSSYLDYMGTNRAEGVILNKGAFPEYFTTAKDFDDFVNDWLTFKVE
ncbi:MAG: transposase [Candidatus Pacebacteria bacterium]|nr:transposase [Candidatus Paceibacterota bacterium]